MSHGADLTSKLRSAATAPHDWIVRLVMTGREIGRVHSNIWMVARRIGHIGAEQRLGVRLDPSEIEVEAVPREEKRPCP